MRVLCERGQTKTVRVYPGLGARSKVSGGDEGHRAGISGSLAPALTLCKI